MPGKISRLTIWGISVLAAFSYGIAVKQYELPPHAQLKALKAQLTAPPPRPQDGPWSIGLYEGSKPFELSPAAGVTNPVITASDVTDFDASFVADPFLYKVGETTYIFYEALDRSNHQGDVAYSRSTDGIHWTYGRRIVDEPFHLSYPQVFSWEGQHYLVPESHQDRSVRLYRAESFPDRWAYVGNLLGGYHYVDPTVFRHADRWWMFVTTPENDVLNLYYSDNLTSGWKPHPGNPLIKFNAHIARPAGRVVEADGRLYRVTQDDAPSYGIQVRAFEILKLTETEYEERAVSDAPIVGPSGTGWNAAGMHQLDLLKVDGLWKAAVDGRAW